MKISPQGFEWARWKALRQFLWEIRIDMRAKIPSMEHEETKELSASEKRRQTSKEWRKKRKAELSELQEENMKLQKVIE